MTTFLQQVINGLSVGSIFALIALGYTMVYGIIKLINFAHGDVYMLGGYVGFFAATTLGLNFIGTLFISMVVCMIVGVLIEKIAYKPLRHASRITSLITAIGVSLFLEYTMMYFVGPNIRTYPATFFPREVYHVFGLQVSNHQLLIFITSLVLMISLQLIVKKTKIGKAMRAVSTDPEAAALMGINVDHTISFTFALGSALAGAAGVMIGVYYNSIDPLMGMIPGLKAFIAAVFGGIGIIPGAMLGGEVIGILETMASGYGFSMMKDAVVYIILIVILIMKPSGLLGKNEKEKV